MSGCDFRLMVCENEKAHAPHAGYCEYYVKGCGDCTCGAAMPLCDKPIVRGGRCEDHKVERRKSLMGNRRMFGSSDTPPSCGNSLCKVEFGETVHHLGCEERGPGWA